MLALRDAEGRPEESAVEGAGARRDAGGAAAVSAGAAVTDSGFQQMLGALKVASGSREHAQRREVDRLLATMRRLELSVPLAKPPPPASSASDWPRPPPAAKPGGGPDEGFVERAEFRRLLVFLCIFARAYEVFLRVDDHDGGAPRPASRGSERREERDDHRLSRGEWAAAVPLVRAAARSWAPFEALKNCSDADFGHVDANGGGFISLAEWCEWLAAAEKVRCTRWGCELSGTSLLAM